MACYITYCPDCRSFSLTTAQFVNDSSSVGHRAACIVWDRHKEVNEWYGGVRRLFNYKLKITMSTQLTSMTQSKNKMTFLHFYTAMTQSIQPVQCWHVLRTSEWTWVAQPELRLNPGILVERDEDGSTRMCCTYALLLRLKGSAWKIRVKLPKARTVTLEETQKDLKHSRYPKAEGFHSNHAAVTPQQVIPLVLISSYRSLNYIFG